MKTAYKRVTGLLFWEVARQFDEMEGDDTTPNFFQKCNGDKFAEITNEQALAAAFAQHNVYRLTEWHEVVHSKFNQVVMFETNMVGVDPMKEADFMAMCRMVTKMSEVAE